ncbi:MAG: FecR family protein, partial [Elusimicrobia bacterium]|nr:FecR family protein [Elusimicrobiota bacterium]
MKRLILSAVMLLACRPASAAYIDAWRGEAELKRAGSEEWLPLAGDEQVKVAAGDELRTARASTVDLQMDDGSRVKIAPLSSFKMVAENKDAVSLGLYFGKVRSWVRKFSKRFEVRTPSAVCAVRGTDFLVSADEDGGSRVEVYEGSVLAGDAKGNSSLVREGQFAVVRPGGALGRPERNPEPPADMNSSAAAP